MAGSIGDFERKSEFLYTLQQILSTVSIKGAAAAKPESDMKSLPRPSASPGGFDDDF